MKGIDGKEQPRKVEQFSRNSNSGVLAVEKPQKRVKNERICTKKIGLLLFFFYNKKHKNDT